MENENHIKFERQFFPSGASILITVPPEILRLLRIEVADMAEIWVEGEKIIIRKKINGEQDGRTV